MTSNKIMTNWFVYHISKPGDPISEGYVGVSTNPENRFVSHAKSNSIIGRAIRKYRLTFDNLSIIGEFESDERAYDLEHNLRPIESMGWNQVRGGKGYTHGHRQDLFIRGKISLSRQGGNFRQSDQHYIKLADMQRNMPRKKHKCAFCSKLVCEGNLQRWHQANCKLAPKPHTKINSFDCDGVLTLGIYPGPNDVIITGRSFEEESETLSYLSSRNIKNKVFLSPAKFHEKTRKESGIHKGNTIFELFKQGILIQVHYDDDWDQLKEIRRIIKQFGLPTKTIWINHGGLITMDNVRRNEFGEEVS